MKREIEGEGSNLSFWKRAKGPFVRTGELATLAAAVSEIASHNLQDPKALGALMALSGLAIRLWIHAHKTRGASRKYYRSMADAQGELEACFRRAMDEDGYLFVDWIGVTMGQVWTTIEPAFDEIALRPEASKVHFQVAMLGGDWLDRNRINPAWTSKRAEIMEENICQYPARNSVRLQGRPWSFLVRRYSHMPQLVGGLINDKYLFLGHGNWDNDRSLRCGDRPFQYYDRADGITAQDQIRMFRGWFDFCFGPKPGWYGPEAVRPQVINPPTPRHGPRKAERTSGKAEEIQSPNIA